MIFSHKIRYRLARSRSSQCQAGSGVRAFQENGVDNESPVAVVIATPKRTGGISKAARLTIRTAAEIPGASTETVSRLAEACR
ncbi:MAG: hypothetical protein Q7T85_04865 [Nitrosomonas sp.]|nr:hypothetical protein [Nitrosomonas sp.]